MVLQRPHDGSLSFHQASYAPSERRARRLLDRLLLFSVFFSFFLLSVFFVASFFGQRRATNLLPPSHLQTPTTTKTVFLSLHPASFSQRRENRHLGWRWKPCVAACCPQALQLAGHDGISPGRGAARLAAWAPFPADVQVRLQREVRSALSGARGLWRFLFVRPRKGLLPLPLP